MVDLGHLSDVDDLVNGEHHGLVCLGMVEIGFGLVVEKLHRRHDPGLIPRPGWVGSNLSGPGCSRVQISDRDALGNGRRHRHGSFVRLSFLVNLGPFAWRLGGWRGDCGRPTVGHQIRDLIPRERARKIRHCPASPKKHRHRELGRVQHELALVEIRDELVEFLDVDGS